MKPVVRSHRDLEVHKTALAGALFVSRLTRKLPAHELALADQARRSARAPGAAIAEAWPKRSYPSIWRNKLSDAQSEACEAQWWLEIAHEEGYIANNEFLEAYDLFEKLISQLAKMIGNAKPWIVPKG